MKSDVIGKRYGRWTVVAIATTTSGKSPCYTCRCDCGTVRNVRVARLESGKSQSCGCLQKEQMSKRTKRHGETDSRLHVIWRGMKQRCGNSNASEYNAYGGRGIEVCKEWRDSFETFRDWALANGYQDNLTIDRIDNDGPYSPENCRWLTRGDQNSNKSNNRRITIGEENHTVTEWAELMGIPRNTIYTRLKRGWAEEAAVMTPQKARGGGAK